MNPRPETFYRYAGEIAQDLDTAILVSLETAPPTCSRDEAQRLEAFAPADTLSPVIRLLRTGLKSVHVAGISGDVARDAILLSLARALAETGRRILVVDADADGPPLAETGQRGLTDLMDRSEPLGRVVLHSPGYDGMMAFLPLGTRPGQLETPGAVEPLIRVLEELRPSYDVILLSAPCLDRRGKVHPAATASEGVLLVLSAGVISRDRIRRNFLQLWGVEAPIRGLVTLGVPSVLAQVVPNGRSEASRSGAGAVAFGLRPDEARPLVAPDSLAAVTRTPGSRPSREETEDETPKPVPLDNPPEPRGLREAVSYDDEDDDGPSMSALAFGLLAGDDEEEDDPVSVPGYLDSAGEPGIAAGGSGGSAFGADDLDEDDDEERTDWANDAGRAEVEDGADEDAEDEDEAEDEAEDEDGAEDEDEGVDDDELFARSSLDAGDEPIAAQPPDAAESKTGYFVFDADAPEAPAPPPPPVAPDRYDIYVDENDVSALLDLQSEGEFELSEFAAAAAGINAPGESPATDESPPAETPADFEPELPISLVEIDGESGELEAEEVDAARWVDADDAASATGEDLAEPVNAYAGADAAAYARRVAEDDREDDGDAARPTDAVTRAASAGTGTSYFGNRRWAGEENEGRERVKRAVLLGASGVGLVVFLVFAVFRLIGGGEPDVARAPESAHDAQSAVESDLSDEVLVTTDENGAVKEVAPATSPSSEPAGEPAAEPPGTTVDEAPASATERSAIAPEEPARTERAVSGESSPSSPGPAGTITEGLVPSMRSSRFSAEAPFYAVHITSFRTSDRAASDASRLARLCGLPADYIDVRIESGEKQGLWYRVIVGHFARLEDAREAAESARRKGITDFARVYRVSGP